MCILAQNQNGLLAPMDLEGVPTYPLDIQRPTISQAVMGGAKYSFSNPQIIARGVMFAVQSVGPREMELWAQRGIIVSHKAYSTTYTAGVQGDRLVDDRFTPPRYYQIAGPAEDMGGANLIWGYFCKLEQ